MVRSTAAGYATAELRSLDAIHLATAQVVLGRRLTAFVTYDERLLAAARDLAAGRRLRCFAYLTGAVSARIGQRCSGTWRPRWARDDQRQDGLGTYPRPTE